jgi:hypothetical protein
VFANNPKTKHHLPSKIANSHPKLEPLCMTDILQESKPLLSQCRLHNNKCNQILPYHAMASSASIYVVTKQRLKVRRGFITPYASSIIY